MGKFELAPANTVHAHSADNHACAPSAHTGRSAPENRWLIADKTRTPCPPASASGDVLQLGTPQCFSRSDFPVALFRLSIVWSSRYGSYSIGERSTMRLAVPWRPFFARTFTAALAIAWLLATPCQSQAAGPTPKRILMLHSYGLRFQPWTDYSEALRAGISQRPFVTFQDHSLLNARTASDKSDAAFVDYLRALNHDQQPDLIIAIGSPAANFVQAHRKDLFPTTPMLFTLVERRRVDLDKLTEYDTVVAVANNDVAFFG
jgi:hypothetical protein